MKPEEMIGRRMRDLRERRGLTQQELGEQVGRHLPRSWPRQTVSGAERGERAFTGAELLAIAHVLEVWVGALLVPPLGVDSIEMPGGSVFTRQDIERVSNDPETRNVLPAAAEALRATGNWLNSVLAQGTVHLKELSEEYESLTGVIGGVQTDAADARLARAVQDVPIESATEGTTDG